MSYIRMNSPYRYVDGFSEDYIFPAETKKGEEFIEDYGNITNKTIVELLIRLGDEHGNLLLVQMGIRLAENLNIKLRKKPLTNKQLIKEYSKSNKKYEKMFNDFEIKPKQKKKK